jgi:hypothetical protein
MLNKYKTFINKYTVKNSSLKCSSMTIKKKKMFTVMCKGGVNIKQVDL